MLVYQLNAKDPLKTKPGWNGHNNRMNNKKNDPLNSEEQEVITSCPHDCGGRCVLKVHLKNGVITRIETDNGEEPQLRACPRGRAYRKPWTQ